MGGSSGSGSSGGNQWQSGFNDWWSARPGTGTGTPQPGLDPMGQPVGATPYLPGSPNPQAGPTNNPYQGQALQNQVSGAFTSGLGGYQDLWNRSGGMIDAGSGASAGAADVYGRMTGFNPQNIQAGQVAGSNLSSYMNPYQKEVIDTTMGEMNRQQAMRQQSIDDQAQAQGAFGGDRMYVQKSLSDRAHGQNQANTLAQLNQANFGNAQQQRQFDIGQTATADARNQAMNQAMMAGGAGGLSDLGRAYSTLGGQFGQAGLGGLQNMSNLGFGFGQDMQRNELAMGSLQQQLNQQMMDQIKNQFYGFANQGTTGLNVLTGGNQTGPVGGTTTSTNKNNPGAMDYLGAGLGIFGLF